MRDTTPHYLMFTDYENLPAEQDGGRWHFVLQSIEGEDYLDATAVEVGVTGERLELLALVRGLEALDQPSRITLVTPSRYVSRGLRFGLAEWREAGWRWESFGTYVPVNNGDLWKRVDNALKYHEIHCRRWRVDQAHASVGHTNSVPDVHEQVA